MKTYQELQDYIQHGRDKCNRKIANNTTARLENGNIIVCYHDTDICIITPDNTHVFYTGGWYTLTTKERINNLLPRPYSVFQEKGIWYLWDYQTQEKWTWAEGITINPDNSVMGAGENPKAILKLRERIKKYAKNYIDKLIKGKIEKPSGGDCWYCLLQSNDGKSWGESTGDTNHLESHITEKYYVPSLFYNAIRSCPISKIAESCLYGLWEDKPDYVTQWTKNILQYQGYKSLVKYLYQEFGLAR